MNLSGRLYYPQIMAQDKKGFLLYADLIETISKVPDDVAGKVFKMILEYVNDQNPETSDLLLQVLFEPIKQQLKRDLVKYEGKKEQWSLAGQASAEKRRLLKEENERIERLTISTNVEKPSTPSTVNVSDNVNVNDNDNESVIQKHTRLFNDSPVWQESICMKHFKGLKKEDSIKLLPDYFKKFFLHVVTQSKENQSINEHKAYFDNWLRAELSKNPIVKNNVQPKSDKYKK